MKRLRHLWLGVVVLVAMACLTGALGGCTGETSAADTSGPQVPVSGGTLAVSIGEPAFIDPLNLVESEGIQVAGALFDSLVSFDPKTSELIPAVAKSWQSSEDATVWTFHLREGTRFHNGREVTAQDFKYAWERISNPANQSMVAYHLAAVKGFEKMQAQVSHELAGLEAVDDHTLVVTLAYPFADFEYVVGHPALAPVPAEEVEKDPAAYAEMPVGNGPFCMAEPWIHDQALKVTRFDDYYGQKPYVDGVDFKVIRDPETAFLEYRAGNLDFSLIPSSEVQACVEQYGESPDGLEVYPGEQTVLGPDVTAYFFIINTEDPILKSLDLRRAVSLAINREAIAETVFGNLRRPASSIIPPGILGYEPDAWPYSRFDRAQAGELLVAAGYPGGEALPQLSLLTNSGGGHEDVLQLVQADLESIGVGCRIESVEVSQFLERLSAGDFQIARFSWTADYPVIDNFLYPLFSSESGNNAGHYANAAVDQAIVWARTITAPAERMAAYQRIVRQVGEEAPVIPIVAYRHQCVGSERVRGLIYSPLGLCNLESCWLSMD